MGFRRSQHGVAGLTLWVIVGLPLLACFLPLVPHLGVSPALSAALNPNPPPVPERLVFIHHSEGEDWLRDEFWGKLLETLNNNKYYVSDTYYEWGPFDPDPDSGTIGDHTDIGQWYNWFLGPRSSIYLPLLYTTDLFTPGMTPNTIPKPAGDNTVVLFHSGFINGYAISGNVNDPPRSSSLADPNPIWGMSYGDPSYTVSNIKGMYRDLLQYFAAHQNKLFILITATACSNTDPGLIDPASPARLRAINTWLVHHWLDGYPYKNVAVFDFFNVLTSNGGNPNINDLGALTGNHHRLRAGRVDHVIGLNNNYSAYTTGSDSHPTAAAYQKATGELVPLLNVAYHAWKGTGGVPFYMGRSPKILPAVELMLLN